MVSLSAPSAIGQSGGAPAPAVLSLGQTVSGELSSNDTQRRSGKFEDVYEFQGRRGERIDLRLRSDDFDAYLVVTGPDGFNLSNDDEEGGNGSLHSRLVLELPADGRYRVSVTTFRPGEVGRYSLAAAPAAAGARVTRALPATPLQVGQSVDGRLVAGRDAPNERYRFTARRGERVRIEASSSDFDTILTLSRPDGTQDVNDDTTTDGRPSLNSRIDTVLSEDGEYVIAVRAYEPDGAGNYRLSLARSAGSPRQASVPGGQRVIALLVGVSDYDRTSDLANTDDDATELYATLQRGGLLHPASVVLTNREATTAAVTAAFRRIAAAAGPNDLFIFMFSGHGNQIDVPVSAEELDGRAETIELFDRPMTDAQLAPLFGSVRARMSLLALDSCYAGGFRNLINRPNIVGMFSSEEDLTSLVASRYGAGGFLSYFLRQGFAGEADDDGDRVLTAGELATYVRRRFRREGDVPATTREDERNYQNILVERGGVNVDDVVVRLSGSAQLASVQPAAAPNPPPRAQVAPQPAPAVDAGGKPEGEEEAPQERVTPAVQADDGGPMDDKPDAGAGDDPVR
ncbi:MAG: pre-peptidase C-terminal domain-containing protein [Sphingomonas sp.]